MLKDKAITAVKTAIAASLVWPVIVGMIELNRPVTATTVAVYSGVIDRSYQGYTSDTNDTSDTNSTKEKVEKCVDDPDCKLIAEVVVYEARGENDKGKAAVAYVVKNRTESPAYSDSVKAVVYQPKQFSYLSDKHKQTKPTEDDWFSAYEVAYNVLNGYVADPTKGATHYHNHTVRPSWSKRLEKTVKIGNHTFYRLS